MHLFPWHSSKLWKLIRYWVCSRSRPWISRSLLSTCLSLCVKIFQDKHPQSVPLRNSFRTEVFSHYFLFYLFSHFRPILDLSRSLLFNLYVFACFLPSGKCVSFSQRRMHYSNRRRGIQCIAQLYYLPTYDADVINSILTVVTEFIIQFINVSLLNKFCNAIKRDVVF